MGLFKKKTTAESDSTASEWYTEKLALIDSLDKEDMPTDDEAPCRVVICIASERANGETNLAVSVKSNNPKVQLDALTRIAEQNDTFFKLLQAAVEKVKTKKAIEGDAKMPDKLKNIFCNMIDSL